MGFNVSNDFKRQVLVNRLAELNQEGFVYQVNYLTSQHLGYVEEAEKARLMCDSCIEAIKFTQDLIDKVNAASDNEV